MSTEARMGLGLLGALFALGVACNEFERAHCANMAEVMGVEYRYGFATTCMLKTKHGWIPAKALRVVDMEDD